MSIVVNSLAISPASVAPGGGQAVVTPNLSDPDSMATITVSADGTTKSGTVLLHEAEVYSVNPADVGVAGKVVAVVDAGGTLAIGPSGTFVFTAS